MYDGGWAKAFVEAVQEEGGTITLEDLEAYEPAWDAPLRTTWMGRTVYAPPAPLVGGMHALEGLNLMEAADPKLRGHYRESAEALYLMIMVARMGPLLSVAPEAYRKARIPSTSFDPETRVSRRHAETLWDHMVITGWLDEFQGRAPNAHSDGVVAVDAEGNVVALTHSINTTLWGDTGIFVDGVSIPDAATFQQARMAAAGPGARVPNEMNPLILLESGEPDMACSAIGGGLHEAMLQRLHDVMEFGKDPKEAAESPPFLSPVWSPGTDGVSRYHAQGVRKGEWAPALLDEVRALGQPILELEGAEQLGVRGWWIGIRFDPETGAWRGGVPADFNGYALAR
jgi:gamma-glutamyltranspeptidase/glutathione hydrolase